MTTERPLTPLQLRFVDAYLADPNRNAAAAYRAAAQNDIGLRSSAVSGNKSLRDPRVRREIERREKEAHDARPLTPDCVKRHLAELLRADPRDLIDYRRGACRYCHGADFQYQRTPQEMRDDVDAYKLTMGERDPLCLHFNPKGGVGFNPNKEPHPDCPECFGRGEGYTYAKDLRLVPASAARLFATIEEGPHGIKMRVRSQDKTLEMALRHLGMFVQPEEDDETPPAASVTYVQQDASK